MTKPKIRRAEVFVLTIAGSLPTLRPLYTQLQGHLPSSIASTLSRKNHSSSSSRPHRSGQEANYTVGSRRSGRDGPRRAGNVTIDLNEIDNMYMNTKRHAVSSIRSNLPANSQQTEALKRERVSKILQSANTVETNGDYIIQVRHEFSIGYDNRSKQNVSAFEQSRQS
jgi:hypothetical protein